jgi:hypothetical protein
MVKVKKKVLQAFHISKRALVATTRLRHIRHPPFTMSQSVEVLM